MLQHLEDSNICPECEDVIHQSHPLNYIAFDRTMQDLVFKIVPDLEDGEYERESFILTEAFPVPKTWLLNRFVINLHSSNLLVEISKLPDFALPGNRREESGWGWGRHDSRCQHKHGLSQIRRAGKIRRTKAAFLHLVTVKFWYPQQQVNLLLEFKSGTTSDSLGKPDSSPLHPNLKRKFIRCSSLATVTHLKKYIAKKLLSSMDKYKDIDVMCNGKQPETWYLIISWYF